MNYREDLLKHLNSAIYQEESTNKFKEIENLRKDLSAASSTIASSIEHEDVAIFIGSTKSGKSTLINYLIDNKLLGVKDKNLRTVCVQKADHPYQDGPEIGRGPTSETIIPTRWESPRKLLGIALWDSPGFEDNRSSCQDIINAFYIYELFKHIRTAKVVLVTDFSDILNDRINAFLSLLVLVENLFKSNLRHCFSSIAVVFTKVPNEIEDEPVNLNFVTDLLEHKILSSTSLEMSQTALKFVRYLIKNDEQIGLFRRASIGPITSNIDVGVVQAIRTVKCIQCNILRDVSPSISHKSKVFLHEIRHDLISSGPLEELGSTVAKILMESLDYYQEKLYSYRRMRPFRGHQLTNIEYQLGRMNKYIKKLINTDTSFLKILKILHKIHPQLTEIIDIDDLIDRKNMMEFIDNLLNLENTELIMHSFRCKMETVKSNVSEAMLNWHMAKKAIEEDEMNRRIKKEQEEREEEERERREEEKRLRKKREESRSKQSRSDESNSGNEGFLEEVGQGLRDMFYFSKNKFPFL